MEVKYDTIGTGYNSTRKADNYLTEQLLHHLKPTRNGKYLDIGCGTGNYTIEIQKKGFHFMGIDPSKEMLEKAKRTNKEIEWKLGSAENTGLAKNTLDGIIGCLTIHHWTNLKSAFTELKSVLKPEGRIVIFTSTPQQMHGYWLNHYFPKMMAASILQMPTLETVQTAMIESGIEPVGTDKYSIRTDLQDKFLYCGKHNPELYFDEKIRHGISSFSSLANLEEVERGLSKLRKDIDKENINEIIKFYENDDGDYLYIIGKNGAYN